MPAAGTRPPVLPVPKYLVDFYWALKADLGCPTITVISASDQALLDDIVAKSSVLAAAANTIPKPTPVSSPQPPPGA